MADNKNIS